ncbi:interleukin-23 receptor [Thamnophis elegans]|uniref:interleukin-23 receptor n=1 Tax=Thamnophis elegans TaxID=35005 RepID=UPI001376D2C6|nr:interleukin-23 receptor [Thamnophis elegans]
MAISKVLLILNVLFCKIPQSLLSHRCLAKGPGIIECSGRVWTEPAPIIQMGQNVSINCHCMENCQKGKLSLILNNNEVEDTLLSVINQTTVQLNLQNYNKPFSTVSCLLKSASRLICGTQFCMGYLPEKPANLTCIKPEQSSNMICTWEPGKKTHLNTNYILYVKSLFTEENKEFVSNNSSIIIPLNQLQKNQTFSISVRAENYLGGIRSEELHVDLNTIVIPAVPVVVQNKTMESPAFKTIIHWKRQTAINETHCEERYKETISEIWHVRDWDANLRNELNTEYNLDANTKYEFQIRCKLTQPRSLWSRWSESTVYITPEKEPAAVLDVWRNFGPLYPNSTQEVTVLIKPLSPKESRGKILNYRIFYEKQGKKVDLCKTTEIHCKVRVPPAVTIIYVTAHNSKGSSKPANIIVKQPPHNYQAFPPPTNIKILSDKQKGISVKWEPPKSIGKTLLWYIVEWISANFSHFHHSIVAWKKVPFQNTSTSIEEGIGMGENSVISVYAVYQKGISRASSIQRNDDYDTGILLGTGVGVAFLSISVFTLIAIKSCRKRVNKMVSSVAPKWLYEEYPKIQNSKVIKYLQENDAVTDNFSEPFLDVVVTEVEEILIQDHYRAVEKKKEGSKTVSEEVSSSEDVLFASNLDVTTRNGYKPQISNKAQLRTSSSTTGETPFQNWGTKSNSIVTPISNLRKDYTSPVAPTWPIVDPNENKSLFDKISLILRNSGSGQSRGGSKDEDPRTQKTHQLRLLLSDEDIQEQTLIPDNLIPCLKTMNEDRTNMSYFPQNAVYYDS